VFLCGSASNEPELWPLFSKTVFSFVDSTQPLDQVVDEVVRVATA
jgi:hypothetical protein